MAGSVYQPAFSLDRVFDPVEHLVQGGAQQGQLILADHHARAVKSR